MLGKGLTVLSALGGHPEGIALSRLATELGLPLSTTHRLLNVMVPPGFVHFDEHRKQYSLGLTVFQLSHRVALVQTLSELALPVMRRLTQQTGEQTLMAVRQDLDLIYLEKVEGGHQIQNHAEVGQRGRLHSSSMGKSLLAFLPLRDRDQVVSRLRLDVRGPNTITDRPQLRRDLDATRERGFAMNEEENEAGIRSIAVPVMGSRGIPVCAICITAPVFRMSREVMNGYHPLLKESVAEIEARLPRGGAPANGHELTATADGAPRRKGAAHRNGGTRGGNG
jgi:DNA-binding IclR family transcriptional regulator